MWRTVLPPPKKEVCDPILVTLLKMRPHYSQSSRENATPSSGTSPLASYKEVPPPPRVALKESLGIVLPQAFKTLGVGGEV